MFAHLAALLRIDLRQLEPDSGVAELFVPWRSKVAVELPVQWWRVTTSFISNFWKVNMNNRPGRRRIHLGGRPQH